MKKLKATCIIWMLKQGWCKYIMLRIIPFVRFSMYYASIEPDIVVRGYRHLEPGDFILTIDRKKLTTILIPGEFSHAAFCFAKGSNKKAEISEMTHEDTHKTTWCRLCNESDRVVIGHNPAWSGRYRKAMIKKDRSLDGIPYDTCFEMGIDALSCSERLYFIDFKKTLGIDTSDLCGIGRPYVSPDDIYKAKNFKVKWDSDAEKQSSR